MRLSFCQEKTSQQKGNGSPGPQNSEGRFWRPVTLKNFGTINEHDEKMDVGWKLLMLHDQ